MRAFAVLLLAAVVLAGCSAPDAGGPGSPPSAPTLTAEQRLDAAETKLLRDVRGEGDLSRINGTGGEGGFVATLEIEFGTEDVMKFGIALGGFFSATFYCQPGKGVMQFGERVLASRGEGQCREFRSDESTERLTGPEGHRSSIASSEPTPDGGLTVVVRDTNETGGEELRTLWLDKDDRVVRMSSAGDDGAMELTFTYGPKRAIAIPTPTGRAPADVDHDVDFDEGVYTWEATGSGDNATLSEFEVRVVDRAEEGNVTLATFQLTAQPQEQGGFRFQFTDSGDGKLGEGDRFTIRNPAWESMFEHDVVVFDTWAGLSIDESPIPGPEPLLLLAVLAVGALVARRRQ
ncbi:MAG TPA: hypothetical protein VGR28_08715 [Candidatus Thermoplasmatota archaeon]|jgi:hypothetical protein|nr:hypothetical protein [Candidatus Thermoplasmatota archaeon]